MARDETFEHRSLEDPDTLVRYLQALAEGLENGKLNFSSGRQEIDVYPQGLLKFFLRAQREDGGVKLTLRMTWKEKTGRHYDGSPLQIKVPEPDENEDDEEA